MCSRPKILIIGAGPAGLAAGIKLSKNKEDFLVIEKDNQVGGFSKTYEFNEIATESSTPLRTPRNDGTPSVIANEAKQSPARHSPLIFRTDIGPHRFFSKNEKLYKFAGNLLKERWLEVPRQTRQFISGKFYDYPVRPAQALINIGPLRVGQILVDYLIAQLQFTAFRKKIRNFEDYITAHFGKSLGRFNIINYTEKIWGIPASTIHTDWAVQRIKGLSVGTLIKNAINGIFQTFRTEGVRTLTNSFHYPEYGTGLIYDTIAEKLQTKGYKILTNTQPIKIRHRGNRITEVILKSNTSPRHSELVSESTSRDTEILKQVQDDESGIQNSKKGIQDDESGIQNSKKGIRDDESGIQNSKSKVQDDIVIQPTNLIESIPIDDFLKLLDPPPPPEVQEARKKIKYRDQVYLFITLNKNRVTYDQWIYFPEKNIPFGRVSEMKNFSLKMSPPGKTSLLIEYFCSKGDAVWSMSKNDLLNLTMKYLEYWHFCFSNEIINSYIFRQEKAYPIYDTNYKEYLSVTKKYLDQFTNLYYIGRPGRFRYNNQDHSLEMGFLAAKSIIDGEKYNLEEVGAEKEYYEKGLSREIASSPCSTSLRTTPRNDEEVSSLRCRDEEVSSLRCRDEEVSSLRCRDEEASSLRGTKQSLATRLPHHVIARTKPEAISHNNEEVSSLRGTKQSLASVNLPLTINQFTGYTIAAGIATVIDMSILYSLTEYANMWYFNAAIIGYMGGIVTNYTLGKIYVFKNRNRAILKQFALFTAIASVGLVINQIVLYGLVEFAELWYVWAKIIAIAIATIWSFTGHKLFTFRIYA